MSTSKTVISSIDPFRRFTKMRMIFSAAIPVLLGMTLPAVLAQDFPLPAEKPPAAAVAAGPCPTIQIQGGQAGRILREGQPVTFGVNIAGGDPNISPTIVWSTSAGTIVSGQGTKTIQVDSTGAGANREIVAELWIGGFAPECGSTQASAAVRIAGPPIKADEFGDLALEKENERIAAFVSSLPQANDQILVIAYAGRNNVRGYAGNALRRIRNLLTSSGVPGERISITDGGFREVPAYEFWLVPEGSEAPKPTPTVDRKEIVYPRTTPSRTAPVKKT